LRRIIIIGTVLAAFGGGAAALAAADANTYGGSISFSPTKAGSAHKPIPIGWKQTITAKSNQAGLNAAPLKDIKTTIYGLTVDTKLLPTCSNSKIESSGGTGCPSKSLVATGTVQSQLGPPSRQGPTVACDPILHVYNGGKNYVWEFFIVPNEQACPAQTGSATPYKGKFTRSGKNLILNVPLPPDVSTDAGGLGLDASLVHEQLNWKKVTKKVKGKTVGYFATVGCKAHKRPFKVKYTDTTGSSTITGKAKC
jgi:hypothetical protein